jgi:hypothetical protein
VPKTESVTKESPNKQQHWHNVDRPRVMVQLVLMNVRVVVEKVVHGEGESLEVITIAVGKDWPNIEP